MMLRLALAVLLSWATPAVAVCVMPAAGDAAAPLAQGVDVPTNLALLAPSAFAPVDDYLLAVPGDGGDQVIFSSSPSDGLVWLLADGELRPATEYTMCASSGFPCAAFRTSDGPDVEPPEAPVATVMEVLGDFAVDTECSGFQNATVVVIEAEPGPDTANMALQRTVGAEESIVRVVPVKDQGTPVALIDHATVGGDATYRVVAYDFAGNGSAPTEVIQSLGCPGACAQAGASHFGGFAFILWAANVRRSRRRAVGEQSMCAKP